MTDFWIILTGSLVAINCAILGSFLIMRRMAMIGDAISHAVLPGIAIAFLFSGTRESLLMLFGAAIFGLITVFLIQFFKNSGVQTDASIGVVFTALFAAGVVLISLFASQVDLDLDCVLFGEIALVPFDTLQWGGIEVGPRAVWGLGITLLAILLIVGLFYKQFKLCSFDPALAAALGIPVALFHYLLMGLVSMATVTSFESVGSILVVGMLVAPPAAAYLLTDRFGRMIVLSVVIGVSSAVLGYAASYILDASIAGSMVTAAGGLFLLALIFSPKHGLLGKLLKRVKPQHSMVG